MSESQNLTVSICLTSFNNARFTSRCLKSIFAQTYKKIHLIVIDDGSTDGSIKILEQDLQDCPFACELVVRPNKGRAQTANEGIERSNSDFHVGTSSDDMLLPEFVERRVEQLRGRPGAVLAYGHYYVIDENDLIVGCSADWADFEDGNARQMLLTKYPPAAQAVMFRKSVLDIHKFNPDIFVEDFELFLRLSTVGEFAFTPDVLAVYRSHSTNVSHNAGRLAASKIQAFELNADLLHLSPSELADVSALHNWNSVDFLLNEGLRLKAFKLALKNSNAKIPLARKLRQYLKLILPYGVVQTTRRRAGKGKEWVGSDINSLLTPPR